MLGHQAEISLDDELVLPMFDVEQVLRTSAETVARLAATPHPEVMLLSVDGPCPWSVTDIEDVVRQAPHAPLIVIGGDDEQRNNAVAAGAHDAVSSGDLDMLSKAVSYALLRTRGRRDTAVRLGSAPLSIDPLLVLDSAHHPVRVNQALTDALGWAVGDLGSLPLISLVHPADRPQTALALRRRLSGALSHLEHRFLDAKGNWQWIEWRIAHDPTTRLIHLSGRDVTARVEERAALHAMAIQDPLTGLVNRAGLDRHLQDAFAANRAIDVAFCDIDHFKAINDILGHGTGDEVLRGVADQLQELRKDHTDLISRYGGDEFVIVGDTAPDGVVPRAVEMLSDSLVVNGHDLEIRVSVGVAERSPVHCGPKDLLEAADAALLRAKNSRRKPITERTLFDATLSGLWR